MDTIIYGCDRAKILFLGLAKDKITTCEKAPAMFNTSCKPCHEKHDMYKENYI